MRSSPFKRKNIQRRFKNIGREKYRIVCARCKKTVDVPFRPELGEPVYCKRCFSKILRERKWARRKKAETAMKRMAGVNDGTEE